MVNLTNLLYKLLGILKYNMFLNYYRVFPQGFPSTSKLYSRLLLPSGLLLDIIAIKEELQLKNLCVLSLSFLQVNPTPVTYIGTECDIL